MVDALQLSQRDVLGLRWSSHSCLIFLGIFFMVVVIRVPGRVLIRIWDAITTCGTKIYHFIVRHFLQDFSSIQGTFDQTDRQTDGGQTAADSQTGRTTRQWGRGGRPVCTCSACALRSTFLHDLVFAILLLKPKLSIRQMEDRQNQTARLAKQTRGEGGQTNVQRMCSTFLHELFFAMPLLAPLVRSTILG